MVLAGHGAPATDCPARLVGELMALQWRDGAGGHSHAAGGRSGVASSGHSHDSGAGNIQQRIAELDAQIRDWPRRPDNDPYKAGLERVAAALKKLLPITPLVIGYNEFCRPSVPEAIEQMIAQGAKRIFVIPSMLTPGGVHSEEDIPRTLQQMQVRHPGVSIEYVWPFDLEQVAGLLRAHIQRAAE